MILVDTSALVALADKRDARNQAARRTLADLEHEQLVMSDYVFDETVTLLSRRPGHEVAIQVGRRLRAASALRIERLDSEDLDAVWALFERPARHGLSFTDCTSIALARRLSGRAIFTFDPDFKNPGTATIGG